MLSFGKQIRKLNKRLNKHGLSNHNMSFNRCKTTKKRSGKRSFGSTAYQAQVNSMAGALGPSSGAFWKNTMTTNGPAYSLGAQPLYYAPVQGIYVTSADNPAAQGSVNFSSFGFGKRRSGKRSGKCGPCGQKFGKRSAKKRSAKKRSAKKRSAKKFPNGKTPRPNKI